MLVVALEEEATHLHASDLPVLVYDIPGRSGVPIATETLLRLADAALYQAKAAGRNQLSRWGVCEARQDQPPPGPAPGPAPLEQPAGG